MPDGLIMSDCYLMALAKHVEGFADEVEVQAFLEPWYGVGMFGKEILDCIHTSNQQTKGQRKEALKAARASKKIKYMDDPIIAEAARVNSLRDNWLIQQGKSTPQLKARMKKAADMEKKQNARLEKAREKSQLNNIQRLGSTNRHAIGAF